MNIAFIPIDNRPVCYSLPVQIADISDDINLFLPDREFLGGLEKSCDTDSILNWLENLKGIDTVVLSLDTVAYGGLIPSRRSNDSYETVKQRLERLKKILEGKNVYAFSSIMRISNNNINQEEKVYWKDYGKKIFEYSYNFHKFKKTDTDIPKEILDDYLATRKRNFEINKLYLEWQKENFFKTLIFSKDDCAEYGLNVMEAKELDKFSTFHFPLSTFIKTGADEIPLSLLSRAITDNLDKKIKVCPIFLEPKYKNLISNYEDISIEQSVNSQLELAGCEVVSEDEADVLLYVNNFKEHQGEIVMKIDTEHFKGEWQKPVKPYILADVRFANGADNEFVKKLFEVGLDENFLGYSAWNTSANTLGSLICGMVMIIKNDCHSEANNKEIFRFAQNDVTAEESFNNQFKQLQITRFLDDWAYQANVRQMLEKPDRVKCKELMKPFEEKIWQVFETKYNVNYGFPWNRLFETEIELG